MKNPLRKRLFRELKDEAGKYVVIFLLMVLSIGFISGFLVADGSMIRAYNESFETYNIEDGHFETRNALNRAQRKAVNDLGITVYDLYYTEKALDNDTTLRLYAERTEINRACLMAGSMPQNPGEVAIDRMYADNNGLTVGDTVTSGGEAWTVTGLVAMSDYSTLFSDNSDSMFDAVKFGVGVVTTEEFETYGNLAYVYAWKYDTPPAGEQEEHDVSEDLMEALAHEVHLEDFVPRYINQAINFTGEDMGSDRAMMITLLYVIIVIMAFVLGITVSNTIAREAAVIGTLRASGYTKAELTRHYMSMPMLVTVVSATLGNILGYTLIKNFCASLYYGSYSLPTYVTRWNGEAFLLTTAVPLVLMAVINFLILRRRLSLSPLKFLRRDLTRKKQRRAIRLPKFIRFFARFRLRVIFQNLPNYAVLFVGVIFANLLLMFGLLLPDILHHYQDEIAGNMLSQNQYMLTVPLDAVNDDRKLQSMISMLSFLDGVETENEDAEKFSAYTLKTTDAAYMIEEVLLYGVEPDSRYIHGSLEDAVLVSSSFAEKDELSPGDTITLKEPYGSETYDFTITGIYDYDAGLTIFMDRAALNTLMDEDEDYFCGYFSDSEIEDIDQDYIGSVISLEDLTKISRQLDVSMGQMMYLVDGFSVIMFLVLIYLLSKIVIEKNAQSISMGKILGYTSGELARLYILSTSIIVLLFLLISLPIERRIMEVLFRYFMMESITGWIPFYVNPTIYGRMFALGAAAYALVAILEFRRIRNVPMDEALKNVE